MAAAAGAEMVALKAHVAHLEPQVSKLQAYAEEASKLKAQESDLNRKLFIMQTSGADTAKHLAELDARNRAFAEAGEKQKEQLAELSAKLAAASAAESRHSAELLQCRSRVAELEQQAKPAAVNSERDDLKKIYGIGPVLERRLNDLGVFFFREIASWTREDVLRFEEHLKEFPDRIERDNWVDGAREEHFKKYGERLLKADSAEA
jgi:predicted flap endonuclease-1-like 5' DNA nuclease